MKKRILCFTILALSSCLAQAWDLGQYPVCAGKERNCIEQLAPSECQQSFETGVGTEKNEKRAWQCVWLERDGLHGCRAILNHVYRCKIPQKSSSGQ